jgi:cobalt-zinc-cadmium efflux system outer membrane protein
MPWYPFRPRPILGVCAVLLGLGGCRAQGLAKPPSEGPAPHLRGTADATGTTSRSAPKDAALPDPKVNEDVTLTEILAFADEHSPVLLVARSTRSRAEAAAIAASPRLYANPQVNVSAGARVGATGTGADVEVGVWQQIQIAGERGVRLTAAERLRELTDADIEKIRWDVHCDVHAAFHQALVNRERVVLTAQVVAFQAEVLGIVERQIKAGETANLSLRLAEAEAAQARQTQVAADQAYLVSRIRLAQLAGWPADRPPEASGALDPPQEPPSAERLLAVAKEELPLLTARKAAVEEARARVEVARRDVWPRPALGVQYRREGNPSPEAPYDIVLGGVSLAIPSFQTNQGGRAEARADVRIAGAELDAATFLLDGQLLQARSEVVAAAERVRSYGTEILPRFAENLVLLRRSFELGEIDLLALSVGRERFLRIQSDALGAHLDYFVALAALERMVGIDLWSDEHHEASKP